MPSEQAIRPAQPGDVPVLASLIAELAEYEKSAGEVVVTTESLEASLFGDSPAVFAHVAELNGEVVGMAIWFLNYSTWLGQHGIYIEDLYVQPVHRGLGLGKALLTELARIARNKGYGRLEWWVLDWNESAIEFYRAQGAIPMDEWTVFRLTGKPLESLAAQS